METEVITNRKLETPLTLFSPGTIVIYGMYGKFKINGIESKGNETSLLFYKLESLRKNQSKPSKAELAIWVPVQSAKERGLRLPISEIEAQSALEILQNKEYYFKLQQPWQTIQPLLDQTLQAEGLLGAAKVFSYLFVLKKKSLIPSPEINKLYEVVHKALFRELSEALHLTPKALEEQIQKGLRSKIYLDQ